jgi:o-succinylbenzoate---CoA ligase
VSGRPLHAAVLPAGPRLIDLLAAALDGTGPAVAPLPAGQPDAVLRRQLRVLAPSAIETPEGTVGLETRQPVADDTAVVIATSGSTGEPKAVELRGAALLASARASLRRIGARPGERWLCCLPPAYIAGIQVLVRAILSGEPPVICDPSDPEAFIAEVERGAARHASLVPTQLQRLLPPATGADGTPGAGEPATVSRLRSILLGGAAAPPGLLAAARDAGARIVTTYGMSETCGGCVYDGVPLGGVRVDIDTGAGAISGTGTGSGTSSGTGTGTGAGPAGADGRGRIRIAGPVLFSGYRLRPDLTAAATDGHWFLTSDIGSVDGTGRLLVHGRADDVINTGGHKVLPAEVAAAVSTHPGVRDTAVIGLPDDEWVERVTVVIVPADPGAPPALAELRDHVGSQLPGYAAPQQLVVVGQIPVLASGKHDLAALKARLREQSGTGSVYR